MDFLQKLLEEKRKLQDTIEAINLLINTYGANLKDAVIQTENIPSKYSVGMGDKIFPIKAKKDKQILWLFDNVIENALKISEVNEIYQKYSGNNDKVNNVARRLKELGKLKVVKYNNSNTLSFWGLPSWIEENDFKEIFKPDNDSLPIDVTNSEVS